MYNNKKVCKYPSCTCKSKKQCIVDKIKKNKSLDKLKKDLNGLGIPKNK